MYCFLVRNSHTGCCGVNCSGCFATESSVSRPELLTVIPAICCTREDDESTVATNTDIPLTAAPFVGSNFSFTPTTTNVVVNKIGVYQIVYSTTASSSVAGVVSIGLNQECVLISASIQATIIGVSEQINLF